MGTATINKEEVKVVPPATPKATPEAPVVEEPKTIEDLYVKHEAMVHVLNNVIGYLNTLEQWRTASFKPKESSDATGDTPETTNSETKPVTD